MADAARKGLFYGRNCSRGETHHMAKLTKAKVIEIKQMYIDGMNYRQIGDIIGLHGDTIGQVVRGTNWKDVGPPITLRNPSMTKKHIGTNSNTAKLDDDKVREIRRMKNDGLSVIEIARHFSVSWSTIGRIISGKRWTHVV